MYNEEDTWDEIAHKYEAKYGSDELSKKYWDAYKYMKNDDYDGGKCGQIREKCIVAMLKKG